MKLNKKEKRNIKKNKEKAVKKLLAMYKVDADETKNNYCGCCGDFCA